MEGDVEAVLRSSVSAWQVWRSWCEWYLDPFQHGCFVDLMISRVDGADGLGPAFLGRPHGLPEDTFTTTACVTVE